MMMSVSGGWFFVVASEAITVSGQTILLPGIGSYIATAIEARDLAAIGYAVLVMLIVILLYDQLLFRPLLAWSAKFRGDTAADEDVVRPWFLLVLQRAQLFDLFHSGVLALNRAAEIAILLLSRRGGARRAPASTSSLAQQIYDLVVLALAVGAVVWIVAFVRRTVPGGEIGWVVLLGLFTAARVVVLIALASLVWVPIGVWIGLRPRFADRAQPVV
jgi:NitT/TauT family transport system permease protein